MERKAFVTSRSHYKHQSKFPFAISGDAFSLPMSALIGWERLTPLPSVGVDPAWGHPPALEPASAPHQPCLSVACSHHWVLVRGLCGGDWLSGWETCSLRSHWRLNTELLCVGTRAALRGDDTLYLPSSQPLVETKIYFALELEGKRACCCGWQNEPKVPWRDNCLQLPFFQISVLRISIRFFLMT